LLQVVLRIPNVFISGHNYRKLNKIQTNKESYMKVNWDSKACCHSGNCVKSLPEVFKIESGNFVIQPENATEAEVLKVVEACPAKAFSVVS
jgi:uncharacterized Fe-S cluster protein YjdI